MLMLIIWDVVIFAKVCDDMPPVVPPPHLTFPVLFGPVDALEKGGSGHAESRVWG